MEPKPPLDIEETLDLVLAAAAHRSSNDKHAEFGRMLLEEYFVKLRERYRSDEVACRYLDNLLACAASAVRALSVARDIFGTRWESFSNLRQHAIISANRLDTYSPLRGGRVLGKILSIISGISSGGLISEVLKTWLGQSNILLLSSIGLGFLLGLFGFDFFLDRYKQHLIKKVESDLPKSLEESWRYQTLQQYRVILRNFLLAAIKVREQWYPNMPTLDGMKVFERYNILHIQFCGENSPNLNRDVLLPIEALWEQLDKIIDRHMAFK